MRRCESCRRRHTLSRAHASCPNRTPPSRSRDTRDVLPRVPCLVSPARAPTRALVPRRRDIGLGDTTPLTFRVTYSTYARFIR
jgi:hypothetical protein